MVETLFICTTCDRSANYPPGTTSEGAKLAQALLQLLGADDAPAITLRSVECLSGCPQPCCAALKAQGKIQMRISQLTHRDAVDLVSLAKFYFAKSDGVLDGGEIPVRLRQKITSWQLTMPKPS